MSRRDLIEAIARGRAELAKSGIRIDAERICAELRDAPLAPAFRNDHGAECTCLACVAERIGFRAD